jgi:polyisoprenoid-binding protein YceI
MSKQQHAHFDLSKVEKLAEGKSIGSVTVHYVGREEPIDYAWEDRRLANWPQVRRCRLNFSQPKCYLVDGDACKRPGFRVKGR